MSHSTASSSLPLGQDAGPSASRPTSHAPPLLLVLAAFLAIYLIWGSTFLGMRIAINTIPPFLMSGTRFMIAGLLMYGFMRFKGVPSPNRKQWLSSSFIGAMLITAGNGAVCWSQQTVPTGIAAMLVGSVPLWMLFFDWVRPHGRRPRWKTVVGMILGFGGVILIVLGKESNGKQAVDPVGATVLLTGCVCWAIGSIYARQSKHKIQSPFMSVAVQMLAGGALDLVIGIFLGEPSDLHPGKFGAPSLWAFLYLTLVGSLIAYTAYVWLLRVTTPAKVSTYAYVNPVIALILGHFVLNEVLPKSLIFAGAMILLAVILNSSDSNSPSKARIQPIRS